MAIDRVINSSPSHMPSPAIKENSINSFSFEKSFEEILAAKLQNCEKIADGVFKPYKNDETASTIKNLII